MHTTKKFHSILTRNFQISRNLLESFWVLRLHRFIPNVPLANLATSMETTALLLPQKGVASYYFCIITCVASLWRSEDERWRSEDEEKGSLWKYLSAALVYCRGSFWLLSQSEIVMESWYSCFCPMQHSRLSFSAYETWDNPRTSD